MWLCAQVRNHELFYEAINFYLDEHPLSLGKLLQVLTTKLDHARVVHQLRRSDNLPLILPFMKSVQKVRVPCGAPYSQCPFHWKNAPVFMYCVLTL